MLRELLIRIRHVLDEHGPAEDALKIYKIKDLEIRITELRLSQSGSEFPLTASEAKLMEILIRRSPSLVSRDELTNYIWGEDSVVSPRTLDNMITKLRQILGVYGDWIKTVRGAGYQWTEEEK